MILQPGTYTVTARHLYHLPAVTNIEVPAGGTLVMDAVLLCCDLDQGGDIDLLELALIGTNFNSVESLWR